MHRKVKDVFQNLLSDITSLIAELIDYKHDAICKCNFARDVSIGYIRWLNTHCVFGVLGKSSDEKLPVVLSGGSGGGVSVHVLMFLRHSVFRS